MQEINGWLFPDGVEVPENHFYRMKFKNRVVWDMDKYGHIYLARQVGLDSVRTEIVDSGVDDDGIRYAAAKTTVVVDGSDYEAIGGADEASDQVRDPEHTHSVAATRSLKNAVKLALGIRPAETEGSEPPSPEREPEPEPEAKPEPAPATDDDLEW